MGIERISTDMFVWSLAGNGGRKDRSLVTVVERTIVQRVAEKDRSLATEVERIVVGGRRRSERSLSGDGDSQTGEIITYGHQTVRMRIRKHNVPHYTAAIHSKKFTAALTDAKGILSDNTSDISSYSEDNPDGQ
ncbi:hypothetical protein M5K25_021276 [Dendrobium thyrsiflorum]|uniref:Uncharacterized protein n=1 Tax=Dendrobium thyrsiflorum TaxID=117978 RepID=A0ABD0UC81_DENTH